MMKLWRCCCCCSPYFFCLYSRGRVELKMLRCREPFRKRRQVERAETWRRNGMVGGIDLMLWRGGRGLLI